MADGDVLVDGEDAEPVGLVELLLRVRARVEILLATRVLTDCLTLFSKSNNSNSFLLVLFS